MSTVTHPVSLTVLFSSWPKRRDLLWRRNLKHTFERMSVDTPSNNVTIFEPQSSQLLWQSTVDGGHQPLRRYHGENPFLVQSSILWPKYLMVSGPSHGSRQRKLDTPGLTQWRLKIRTLRTWPVLRTNVHYLLGYPYPNVPQKKTTTKTMIYIQKIGTVVGQEVVVDHRLLS